MELWAYCSYCERWYYCQRVSDEAQPVTSRCPVCATAPCRFEERVDVTDQTLVDADPSD